MKFISERRLRFYQKRRREALEYVRDCNKQGHSPTYNELHKKFSIGYLKISVTKLYLEAGISFLNTPIKRPKDSAPIVREELIDYIKDEVSKNHHPSRREIENKFKLRLAPVLFFNLRDLYRKAGISYKPENNQELKIKKAQLLTDITLHILPKIKFAPMKVRDICERGIDILARDDKGDLIGVEIKAYNKYEMVKKRNIKQLRELLVKEKLSKILLITTTDRIESNLEIPENITIILFEEIKKICNGKYTEQLDFIRDYSTHEDTQLHKRKREDIIKYVRRKFVNGEEIRKVDINKDLNLNVLTYFSSMVEVYLSAGLLPPLGRGKVGCMRSKNKNEINERILELWKLRILSYIRNHIKLGHYPSASEIEDYFGIRYIWNFFRIKDLYNHFSIELTNNNKKRIRVAIPSTS